MALTINTEIALQEATNIFTYCYLYEPLRIVATEDNSTAEKLYVDLEILDATDDTVVIEELLQYAEFDLNPGETFSFDLMEIAQQYHDAKVFKFGDIDDITNVAKIGWQSVVSKYKYNFKVYTDVSPRQHIKKLPLLGGRILKQFSAEVDESTPINEFEYYGLDINELENRWTNNWLPQTTLLDPALQNAKPTMASYKGTGDNPLINEDACIGWLIWKSRFCGWMFWGFDIQKIKYNKRYEGRLEVGMFESTLDSGGIPYIPVDYTGINTSYSLTMKSLGLSSEELLAVAGIEFSPAVYYSEVGSTKLELMRLTSATAPIDNLANGGDFSVSLKSISKTGQKTI